MTLRYLPLFLVGIIVSLTFLFWQSTEALKAQASHLPTLDVAALRFPYEDGSPASQITASTIRIGSEIEQGRPGELFGDIIRHYCQMGNSGAMFCSASDIGFTNDSRRKVIINLLGHENQPQLWQQYFSGTGLPRGPFIVGREAWPSYEGTPYIKGQVQFAIYENRICFAPLYPEAGSVELTILDSCVIREVLNGQPDLKFTAGDKYIYLSELVALVGR